jgi:hypothetical protein
MTIIFEDGSGLTYKKDVTDKQLEKIKAILEKEEKPKKVRKPKLPYVELENADFGNDIFNDDGDFDLDYVSDALRASDYISWSDKTGEKDNERPFRILINNKYLVEFEVGQGECVEATWDSRIWRGECLNIKLISNDETVKDVKRSLISRSRI